MHPKVDKCNQTNTLYENSACEVYVNDMQLCIEINSCSQSLL